MSWKGWKGPSWKSTAKASAWSYYDNTRETASGAWSNYDYARETASSAWNDRTQETEQTTVVLTGLPKTLNAEVLLSLLDKEYLGCYDYFYLPMDEDKFTNTGIAYINFRDHDKAVECQRYFAGFSAWPGGHFSDRTCRAQWSSIQGYEANIQRQQKLKDWVNSNLPEDCKPMVFDEHGLRLPTLDVFPPQGGWTSKFSSNRQSRQWEDEWYGGIASDKGGPYSGNGSGYGWRFTESNGWATTQGSLPYNGFPEVPVASDETVEDPTISALSLQEVEGAGYEEKDTGVPNLKVSELFEGHEKDQEDEVQEKQEDPEDANDEENQDHQENRQAMNSKQEIIEAPKSEPKALLALTRYACISCSASFAKWSACQQHILNDPKCRTVLVEDETDLQERCKAKANDLPPEQQDNGKLKVADFDLRRFQ